MSTTQIPMLGMKVRQFARPFQYSMIALALMNICPLRALAQDGHSHTPCTTTNDAEAAKQSALLKIVRDSTERFKDVKVAERREYALQFGCVSGDDFGAMGLHYVNGALVKASGVVDATRPQIVIYEPTARRKSATDRRRLSGSRRRVGCEASGCRRSSWDSFSISSEPQSLRAPGLLHAACLGVEGESQGRVRELAPQRFVPVIRRPNTPESRRSSDQEWQPLRSACRIEEAARHNSKRG